MRTNKEANSIMRALLAVLVYTALITGCQRLNAQPPSPSVTLVWNQEPTNPPAATYNLYRASKTCATAVTADFTKQNTAPIAALTYLDANVSRGQIQCYRVTVAANGQESAPSNTAEALIGVKAVTLSLTVNP